MKFAWRLIKATLDKFTQDRVTTLAAALAYYAIFSIAPLLVIAIGIAGLVFRESAAQQQVAQQIGGVVGPQGAAMVQRMLASQTKSGSLIATIIGIVVLLLGASGVFGELKTSLDVIFRVQPKPGRGLFGLVLDRLMALLMVLVIGIFLLATMLASTAVSVFSREIGKVVSLPGFVIRILQLVISWLLITGLFVMIFKFLPDVKIRWRKVLTGAALTALLFLAGEYLMGLYLAHQGAASTFGAAGSLVVILMWIYYSSLILFAGAEFTYVYAKETGAEIQPAKYAEWMPGMRPKQAEGG